MTSNSSLEQLNALLRKQQNRRDNLRMLSVIGAGLLLPGAAARAACILAPSMTEGPYWVEEKLNRQDITTNTTRGSVLNGLPLTLAIQLQDDSGQQCSIDPARNVQVDIWHCDAAGEYSDASGNGQSNTLGQNFLRGYQITSNTGLVTFKTIYPGWYSGRTAHIHVRARVYNATGNTTYNFTSQLFFDDAITDQVYQRALYATRGTRNTRNSNDSIYRGTSTPPIVSLSTVSDGSMRGEVTLGLAGLPATTTLQSFNAALRKQGDAARPDLYADFTVATEDIGHTAELYIAAKSGANWYFHNGVTWLKVADPTKGFPSTYRGALASSHAVKFLSGVDVASLGQLTLFAGYGVDNLDMLQNSRYKIIGVLN
jgi:protocatechuate 3,4-dioxygenase beta subunit